MTALGVVAYGLLGFVTGGALRIFGQHSSAVPVEARPLAPPMVLEMLTAVLFSALAWRVGARPELLAYSWFAAVGVLLAAIDWRTRRLPTRLIWPGGVVLAMLFSLAAMANDDWEPLLRSAAAMLVLLVFYGLLYVVRPDELGGGDLRLGVMTGLPLGWAGWPAVTMGTLLGWVTAAVSLTAFRFLLRNDTPRDLPLGPFLVIGSIAGVLVSAAGLL